ncbi:MAG: flagellar hook-associated protein FlgK [Pseudomonadota bacterium]
MSISQALSIAGSGLAATSRQASVVSSNVTNALTPGYARREVQVGELTVAGLGAGVEVLGVTRAEDRALTASRRLAEGDSARDDTLSTTQTRLSNALGGPDDEFSFFKSIENLEASFASLREMPESVTQQNQTLEAAKRVTRDFQQLSTEATQIRMRADDEIARQVDEVNDALGEIDVLNAQIRQAQSGGQDTAALEDQRQRLIDRVSNIIPIRETQAQNGEVGLITTQGVYLLSGSPFELEFTPTTPINPAQTYEDGSLSGLTVGGVDITPSSDQSLRLDSGSLAAQFQIRDEIAVEYTSQLDALAEDLIRRFSDPANDTSLDGTEPGLFTDAGGALNAPVAPGLAGRIEVNNRVDPAVGGELYRMRDGVGAEVEGALGDSTLIDSVLDGLREPQSIDGPGFSGALSIVDAAAEFSSLRASASLSAERAAATSQARTSGLVEAEQQATGVDTDFELQNLLRIEQAYQANARVIQVIDGMLDRLLEI